jgi:hypothetical protein
MPTVRFLGTGVFLPYFLGVFLAGAALEPLHQPFALVVPNLRRRMRDLTIATGILLAFGAATVVTLTVPIIPFVGALGLSIALPALPSTDRSSAGNILISRIIIPLILCLLCFEGAPALKIAIIAAPVAFLLGGGAMAVAFFAFGFSRGSSRRRSETPFIAIQHITFSSDQEAARRALARRHPAGKSTSTRPWNVRNVGYSTRCWAKVAWHGAFGQIGVWKSRIIGMMYILVALSVGASLPILLAHRSFSTGFFWRFLAMLATPGLNGFDEPLKPMMPIMLLSSVLSIFRNYVTALRSVAPYPISRQRQARVMFMLLLSRCLFVVLLAVCVILGLSLLGQWQSGIHLPTFGLPGLFATAAALAAIVCINLALLFPGKTRVRMHTASIVSYMVGTLALLWLAPLSTFKVSLLAVSLAAGAWGLWMRLNRYYLRSDLV